MDEKEIAWRKLQGQIAYADIVCDPVSFIYRQHGLLKALANYILERDMPEELKNLKKEMSKEEVK